MLDYPPQIGGTVLLPTGDRAYVMAFLMGVCEHGFAQYELAWPDGTPLNLLVLNPAGLDVTLDMVPPRSAVAFRL